MLSGPHALIMFWTLAIKFGSLIISFMLGIWSIIAFACCWKDGSAIIFWTSRTLSGSFIISAISAIADGSFIACFMFAMPSSAVFSSPARWRAIFSISYSRAPPPP